MSGGGSLPCAAAGAARWPGLARWSSTGCAFAPTRPPARPAPRRAAAVRVDARNRQRRLLSVVLSAPQRLDRYLESAWWRRWMWAGISLGAGFYAGAAVRSRWCVRGTPALHGDTAMLHKRKPAGNIATLSFGALAINDVLAAVVTLMFCEVVTHVHYTRPTLLSWFANHFKMGVIAALLSDAAKLGS